MQVNEKTVSALTPGTLIKVNGHLAIVKYKGDTEFKLYCRYCETGCKFFIDLYWYPADIEIVHKAAG